MNIDFGWVRLGSIDADTLEEYCDSPKAIVFCWWVHGDLTGSDYSQRTVSELVSKARAGQGDQSYRGNIYWLKFSEHDVEIMHPRTEVAFRYSYDEFESAFERWINAVRG